MLVLSGEMNAFYLIIQFLHTNGYQENLTENEALGFTLYPPKLDLNEIKNKTVITRHTTYETK